MYVYACIYIHIYMNLLLKRLATDKHRISQKSAL